MSEFKWGSWYPIATAPKGGGAEMVTDPAWVEPPKILLRFAKETAIAHWDWYYAEGGNGYDGTGCAWVLPEAGELAHLHYDYPTHWMPLPPSPEELKAKPRSAPEVVFGAPREYTLLIKGRQYAEAELVAALNLAPLMRKRVKALDGGFGGRNWRAQEETRDILLSVLKEAGLE